ncbi:adenosylhomocysteinase [Devosia lacusdianchii]|uniref:adenosylhomocysteinase n=1 Tax=Devosia lacusdianchii TaxID=2917991 RepID=UPI001F06FEAC|nr:adenosylhomocysteinase [Devosia sp. JXJ CY 41]
MSALLEQGLNRVDWIRSRMALLARVRKDFATSQPFKGKTIGVSLHLEPKTAVLIETLAAGGARIVGTGNYGSTQDDVVAALRHWGMTMYGQREIGWDEHLGNVRKVVEHQPDILLDNGADLVALAVEMGVADKIIGGTEETTSGDDRLRADFAGKVPFPVIVINDSPLKQIVENKHAVGQGNVESIMRMTNLMINGRRFVMVGYGWCGRGMAQYIRSFGGQVAVVEKDPIKQLEAVMDGFRVGTLDALAPWGQFFCTATARERVVGSAAFAKMPDGAILANSGHFPTEIDTDALRSDAKSVRKLGSMIEEFTMQDGRKLILLTEGRMIELAGVEAKGNSIEAMDLGFMLQSLSLERVATRPKSLALGPQAVPVDINRTIAAAMVADFAPDA